ncbi:MAG TPA: hypothetical protein VHT05_15050 [Candidatus Elarobacter sp.]|jgi:hypothetical protein|nr:hypothetical protein [Candidatus Elarobacter sp.]
MKRLAIVTVAALVAGAGASAQPFPGDPGLGVQRGMEQLNNSGQVGTVTLFAGGPNARVVVELHGTRDGRTQAVRLYRGPSCDALAAAPVYVLTEMRSGRSVSLVKAPESTLLSGNYNAVVLSSTAPGAKPTACGHLYAS